MVSLSKSLFPFLIFALILGCSESPAEKLARYRERASKAFAQEKYAEAILDYKNVLRIDPENVEAIEKLGLAYYHQGQLSQAFPYLFRTKELNPHNIQARVKLATIFLLGRKTEEAEEEANFVLSQEPNSLDALVVLAGTATNEDDVSAIAGRLKRAQEMFADQGRPSLALGAAYLRIQNSVKAEELFKEAIVREPDSIAAHAALADLYVRQRKFELAEAEFKTVAGLAPAGSRAGIRLADFYSFIQKPKLARQVLEDIVKKDEAYLPAYRRLARIALSENKPEEAKQKITSILEKDPKDLEGQFLQGQVDLVEGRTEDAIQKFQEVLKVEPRLPQVRLNLAQAYLRVGQAQQAKQELRQTVESFPNYTAASIALAELNLSSRATDTAIDVLQESLKQRPQDRRLQFLLGRAYIVANKPEEALEMLAPVIKAAGNDPRVRHYHGLALLQTGSVEDARKEFETALGLAPGYLPSLRALVRIAIADKNPDLAIALVEKQLRLVPTSAPLHQQLGDVYLAKGDMKKAEDSFVKAAATNPQYFAPYLSLANLYARTDRPEKALEQLEKALEIDPKSVPALMLAGMIHQKRREASRARELYEQILEVNRRFGPAANNLAYLYMEEGKDLDKALQLAQIAKEVMPESAQAADTIGWILYKRGIYNQALGHIEESARKLPDNAEIQYHLGMTYYQLGRIDDAREALGKALASKTSFEGEKEARETLAKLRP